MSEAERVFTLLKKALREAGIRRCGATNDLPPVSNACWREIGKASADDGYLQDPYVEYSHDIEVVFDSASLPGEILHASVRLYRLAEEVVTGFSNEADAVSALSVALEDMRETILGILPGVHRDLGTRGRNLLLKRVPELSRDPVMQAVDRAFVEPERAALESKRKERKARLRGSRKKGERGKDRKPRERTVVAVPAHERTRQRVISTLIEIRSLPEKEMEKRWISSKRKWAEVLGIHPTTLRRSELDGGWEVGDLEGMLLRDLRAEQKRAGNK